MFPKMMKNSIQKYFVLTSYSVHCYNIQIMYLKIAMNIFSWIFSKSSYRVFGWSEFLFLDKNTQCSETAWPNELYSSY